ncbi:MAG: hypothetical protein ACKVUS_15755 [Saprospiraceae bacterium]
MRFVIKSQDLADIPEAIRVPATIPDFDLVLGGDKEKIYEKVYKGEYRRDGKTLSAVREALNRYYLGKCAYCEDIEKKAEIEHYRPKKEVAGEAEHSGYFWLCYQWTNLVPSCRYCNTEGGKGNKFPVMGTRVTKFPKKTDGTPNYAKFSAYSAPLKSEKPYLLHPEMDDPKKHFKFDAAGTIIGIDAKGRGKETINICNLNRDNLLALRQRLIDDLFERMADAFFLFLEGDLTASGLRKAMKLVFIRMEERQGDKRSFTLLAWYVFENFKDIFIPMLQTVAQREAALDAYIRYRKGQL